MRYFSFLNRIILEFSFYYFQSFKKSNNCSKWFWRDHKFLFIDLILKITDNPSKNYSFSKQKSSKLSLSVEKNRLWTLEAADSRNVIFSQLHYEVVKRHGFEKGGIKFGQIVNLLFDIELLAADFSNVRILRKLLMKGGDDVFMLEDDSLLK